MKKVAISGYFDPIHVGHLEYMELSKKMGDYLIVIINNKQSIYIEIKLYFSHIFKILLNIYKSVAFLHQLVFFSYILIKLRLCYTNRS